MTQTCVHSCQAIKNLLNSNVVKTLCRPTITELLSSGEFPPALVLNLPSLGLSKTWHVFIPKPCYHNYPVTANLGFLMPPCAIRNTPHPLTNRSAASQRHPREMTPRSTPGMFLALTSLAIVCIV